MFRLRPALRSSPQIIVVEGKTSGKAEFSDLQSDSFFDIEILVIVFLLFDGCLAELCSN